MPKTQIIGTGAYAPEKVITNKDLEKIVDTTDQWIRERTGIQERRAAAEGEQTSDMAVKASIRALEMAKTRPEDLDMIVVGTISPDMPMPSCAAFVQAKLGATRAFAFDLSAACAGSLYALAIADQFIRTGSAKRVLIVGVELLTRIIDWEDRNTCVLFGDAAGAMVLAPSADDSRGVLSVHLHSDGTLANILCLPGGGSKYPVSERVLKEKLHKVSMQGREVYKAAVRCLSEVMMEALAANHLTTNQITHVISHQANLRILESVMQRLGIPMEKCWVNIQRYGNTSSASVPMTLDEANRAGRLNRGDLIAMMAIGAGIAWGGAIVRW
ncbi:MAG TPA: beta-ketoacyl-ACP synthase III [Myxococcaceae bacterium]|nr:beta-ketoacyl-ACP synthase III [Myxococcaceae bacterium]